MKFGADSKHVPCLVRATKAASNECVILIICSREEENGNASEPAECPSQVLIVRVERERDDVTYVRVGRACKNTDASISLVTLPRLDSGKT